MTVFQHTRSELREPLHVAARLFALWLRAVNLHTMRGVLPAQNSEFLGRAGLVLRGESNDTEVPIIPTQAEGVHTLHNDTVDIICLPVLDRTQKCSLTSSQLHKTQTTRMQV